MRTLNPFVHAVTMSVALCRCWREDECTRELANLEASGLRRIQGEATNVLETVVQKLEVGLRLKLS